MYEKKLKIIGIVIVLMLLCVACVGAASATTVYSQTELQNIMTNGGTATLGQNIELTSSITVKSNATLDLRGNVLYRPSSSGVNFDIIIINEGVSLTINDGNPVLKHYFTIGGEAPREKKAGLWQWNEEASTSLCTVSGGVITGGVNSGSGGGIYIKNNGTLTMNGGSIVGNSGSYGGGVYSSNGTLTMNGGSIVGNSGSYGGGGMYISGGTVNMGAKYLINYNTSMGNGGGVYIMSGSYKMNGGTISGNTAKFSGGGVYNKSIFTMNDGTISGNTASNDGDEVYNSGDFTQNGGTIDSSSSSTASEDLMLTAASSETNDTSGVSVYNAEIGRITILGGEVKSNYGNELGFGVYNCGTMNVGGTPVFVVYLPKDEQKVINYHLNESSIGWGFTFLCGEDELTDGAKIGIRFAEPVEFVESKIVFKQFKSKYIEKGLIECKNTNCKFGVDDNGDPVLNKNGEKINLFMTEEGTFSGFRNVSFSKNPLLTGITFNKDKGDETKVKFISGLNPRGSSTTGYPLIDGFRIKIDNLSDVGGKIYFKVDSPYPDGVRLMYFELNKGWKLLSTTYLSDNNYEASIDKFEETGFTPLAIVQYSNEPEPTPTPSHNHSTTFSAKTVGTDGKVTFDRAVTVTEGTFPGATSVKITNTSGDGWYNFEMTAPGFTGNGSINFKVPHDVLAAKKMTTSDVGLYHKENNEWVLKPTTYLKSDSQYAYYTGTFDSCSPFKIDFEEGASIGSTSVPATAENEDGYLDISSTPSGAKIEFDRVDYIGFTPQSKISLHPGTYSVSLSLDGYEDISRSVTIKAGETTSINISLTKKSVTETQPTTQPTTKSPFPILGVFIGLGAAAFLIKRRP